MTFKQSLQRQIGFGLSGIERAKYWDKRNSLKRHKTMAHKENNESFISVSMLDV